MTGGRRTSGEGGGGRHGVSDGSQAMGRFHRATQGRDVWTVEMEGFTAIVCQAGWTLDP